MTYTTTMDSKTLTTAEAALRLKVSQERVRVLCKQRRIPGARLVGRLWLLPAEFKVTPGSRGPKLKGKR